MEENRVQGDSGGNVNLLASDTVGCDKVNGSYGHVSSSDYRERAV